MLEELNPKRVFYYFEEISKIPRGSYNTKAVSDYCVQVAKKLGLTYRQDSYNNVILKKPGSVGCEHAPALLLQGHLDMVCEQEPDTRHDFMKDGLSLMITEDGYVKARGTTLGGDDGIAVAMALAILEDDSLVHPPLEVVFTTEEEVGMDGAIGLDCSDLQAQYMLNLDSEDEGILTVSCAGGSNYEIYVPYEKDLSFDYAKALAGNQLYVLTVDGLIGGHSGVEIQKGRASSNQLMGQLLMDLHLNASRAFQILSVKGGLKHNAIPRKTDAVLYIQSPVDVDCIREQIQDLTALLQQEYASEDPNLRITLTPCGLEYLITNGFVSNDVDARLCAMTKDTEERFIKALYLLPYGVQKMSREIENLPETSVNLGILRTEPDRIYLELSNRSNQSAGLSLLEDRIVKLATILGCPYKKQSSYPGWAYRKESVLRDLMVETYERMYGTKAKVEAIHAGLECGILAEKMPNLDIVSTGPNILDIHTPSERMEIVSVARTYDYVTEVIQLLANIGKSI